MKEMFENVKSQQDFLERQHITDLVDTLIGRKKMKINFRMVLADMLSNFIPCKKVFLTEKRRRTKRIFDQAQMMLNK